MQVGVRRALGSTGHNILHHFLIDNALISTFGIVLGTGLAIGFNLQMMTDEHGGWVNTRQPWNGNICSGRWPTLAPERAKGQSLAVKLKLRGDN
jgi:hypothetical protein